MGFDLKCGGLGLNSRLKLSSPSGMYSLVRVDHRGSGLNLRRVEMSPEVALSKE